MCTVTWLQDSESYRLFCNRDELRTRKSALSPNRHRRDGVTYLAPVDGEAGGSWIAVNEYGLALCLLNDYRPTVRDRPDASVSRGHLVATLATAREFEELSQRWREIDLEQYQPFRMLALGPGREPCLFGWTGVEASLLRDGVGQPLSSSSFDDEGAAASRRRLLDEFLAKDQLPPEQRLLEFQRSHLPERGPYSVCMHRPDAVTVSFSLIEVNPEHASLAYAPGAPCSTPSGPPLGMSRAAFGVRSV